MSILGDSDEEESRKKNFAGVEVCLSILSSSPESLSVVKFARGSV